VGIGRWAIDTAQTAARVGEGVQFTHQLGRRAVDGASGAWRGARGSYRLGVAARHGSTRWADDWADDARVGTLVGADVYHGDGHRGRALAQLNADFERFRAEVEPMVAQDGAAAARVQWWRVDVQPVLADWASFYRSESTSWMTRFATEWSTYVAWLTQIRALRLGARLQGIALVSPEPATLPETMSEQGAAGRGGWFETIWTFLKTIVYAAVGVVGVFSIYTVWRDLRSPKALEAPP
jgi:hypothetical protein